MNGEQVKQQYEKLMKKKNESMFYKVDLHIHTPGSNNDYKFNGKKYENVKLEELKWLADKNGLYEAIGEKFIDLDKDQLMAMLIVHEAYSNKKLNLIAITDHNTVEWYEIIANMSIKYIELIKWKNNKNPFYVVPGVEITCFNGTHIIALFDEKNYKEHWRYIRYKLNGRNEGNDKIFTTKSEIDVIEAIKSVGGIVYIPHLDNNSMKEKLTDMLTPLSGSSKVALLTSNYVDAIGFTDYEKRTIIKKHLENKNDMYYKERKVAYLQDSDAHSVEEIGMKTMYIKMNRLGFNSLKFAISDPETRVSITSDEKTDRPYIMGLVCRGGYLNKLQNDWEYYRFSKDLNCIIGSRGSGKSALIKCIQSGIKSRAFNPEFRNFIGGFENILIYLYKDGNIYCISIEPKVYIDEYSGEYTNQYGNRISPLKREIDEWIKVYRYNKSTFKVLKKIEKLIILNQFQIDFYEQAKIYEIGTNIDEMNEFIDKLLYRRDTDEQYSRLRSKLSSQKKNLKKIKILNEGDLTRYIDRLKEIEKVELDIVDYKKDLFRRLNKSMENRIKFNYEDVTLNLNMQLQNLLYEGMILTQKEKEYIEKYSTIIHHLSSDNDVFNLIKIIKNDKINLEIEIKESKIIEEDKIENIEIKNKFNIMEALDKIYEICLIFIQNYYCSVERLKVNIEFNVNSYEGGSSKPIFKNLNILSHGQRAVAILSIISEDITDVKLNFPLIIDQPEDQLDNRFIYKHLVKSIRQLKEKRQIILVTHNPNIPVSGDAENVICLNSDNNNGWPESHGALDEKSTQRNIINIMEGGEESLKLRIGKYSHNLKI